MLLALVRLKSGSAATRTLHLRPSAQVRAPRSTAPLLAPVCMLPYFARKNLLTRLPFPLRAQRSRGALTFLPRNLTGRTPHSSVRLSDRAFTSPLRKPSRWTVQCGTHTAPQSPHPAPGRNPGRDLMPWRHFHPSRYCSVSSSASRRKPSVQLLRRRR